MRRIWVVGASQGIGLALVKQLLTSGYYVVASSRTAEQAECLQRLSEQYPVQLYRQNLDVTDISAIPDKTTQAWQQYEGLDVWLYNAGAYQPMTYADASLSEYEQMMAVNYFGCVAIMTSLKTFLPNIEKQQMRWIWNLSLSSQFGLPFSGGYSAPKAALLNLAESLAPELKTHHIKLQVINHGFVKTALTDKNTFAMPGLLSTDEAATKILAVIHYTGNKFEFTFPFILTRILKLLKLLPYSVSLSITKRLLKQ